MIFINLLKFFFISLVVAYQGYGSEFQEELFYELDSSSISQFASDYSNSTPVQCDTSSNISQILTFSNAGLSKQFILPPIYRITLEIEFGTLASTSFTSAKIIVNGVLRKYLLRSEFSTIDNRVGEACSVNTLYNNMARSSERLYDLSKLDLEILFFYSFVQVPFSLFSLRIYLTPCHPSCKSCQKSYPSCDSCNINSSLQTNGKCSRTDLSVGQYYEQGENQASCSLSNYFPLDSYCFYHHNCESASLTSVQCSSCKSSYFLWQGDCYKTSFQNYYPLTYTYWRLYFKDKFSTLEYYGDLYPTKQRVDHSICGSFSFGLGYLAGGINSYFRMMIFNDYFQQQVLVIFKYIIIDADSLTPGSGVSVTVILENYSDIISFSSDELVNYCGSNKNDILGIFEKQYEISSYQPKLIVKNTSTNPDVYFGIREVSVFNFRCENYCEICKINECVVCNQGFEIRSSQCQCINGIIISSICYPCSPYCSSCSGTLATQCINCLSSAQKISGPQCVDCVIGYYSINGQCERCQSSCLQCQISENNCISCKSTMYLVEGECVDCLDTSKYVRQYSVCKRCHILCNSCLGIYDTNKCFKCFSGYYLDSQSFCQPCSQNCKNCNAYSCLECNESNVSLVAGVCVPCLVGTYAVNGVCISCDDKTKFVIIGQTCKRCHSTCNSCLDSGSNQCSNCFEANYLDSDKTCKPCPSGCKSCIADVCTQCYENIKLINGNCIPCPSGTYLVEGLCVDCSDSSKYVIIGKTCKRCYEWCNSCSGNLQNECKNCFIGYYLDNQNACQQCTSNCNKCDATSCTQCKENINLINGICIPCDPGIYAVEGLCLSCSDQSKFIIIGQTCKRCHTTCNSCFDSGSNQCSDCFERNYLSSNNTCQPCSSYCKKCNATSCSECNENINLINGICVPCANGLYAVDGQCLTCFDTINYIILGNICKRCHSSCNSCFGENQNQCKDCFDGYYLGDDNTCKKCLVSDCKKCTSTICTECSGAKKLMGGNCVNCLTEEKKYSLKEFCYNCHDSCKTCAGGGISNFCLECTEGYFMSQLTKICEPCLNELYLGSKGNCVTCDDQCKECNQVNETTSYSSNQFCNYCYCKVCSSSSVLHLGKCYDSCETLGQDLIFNPQTKQCECKQGMPVIIKVNNKTVCLSEAPFGYFCPSDGSVCVECKSSCEKCESANACSMCLTQHYMWKGECVSSCFPSLSIIANESKRICECEAGKQLKKRDAHEIENSSDPILKSQELKCLQPLQLELVELVNSLSKPKYRQNIPEVIQNNFFILTYNRRPSEEEFSSFQFYLMKDKLTRDKDYQILKVLLETEPSRSILIEISIESNKKITDVDFVLDSLNDRVFLNNAVLISKGLTDIIEKNSSKDIANGMGEVTKQLTNPESSVFKHLINFSKELQFVCSLSNFVQLLTPIYFLHNSLPPLINSGSLLGASFIFKQVPTDISVEFGQQSQQTRVLSDQSNDYHKSLTKKLTGFGLSENIFSNFIGVHFMVFTSVVLTIFCYISRKAFTGKQHTIALINKISNTATAQLQSSITMIICMIAYCFSSGEGVTVASIYLAFYLVIYLHLAYLSCFKTTEYLLENIPNFFVDINHQVKGAKWYLAMQFIKKHIVIILILSLYKSAIMCCILVAILFLLQAGLFIYLRNFKNKLILIAKVGQEISIAVLFILLVVSISQYEQITEQEDISNDELMESVSFANKILISIIICIILSFLFSIYRMVLSLIGLVNAWKKYKEEQKPIQFEDGVTLNQSIQIQMQQQLNYLSFQVQVENLDKQDSVKDYSK